MAASPGWSEPALRPQDTKCDFQWFWLVCTSEKPLAFAS